MSEPSGRVLPLLTRLLDLEEGEQAALLGEVGRDDPVLREAAERLLSASPESLRRVSQPVFSLGQGDLPADRLGPYQLERLLGVGGTSSVYLACRPGEGEPAVALKLVHLWAGHPGQEALHHRFEREVEILRRLEHPRIARFIEAGFAPDGRPYLVMERVSGQPLTEHCRTRQLGLAPRLLLMRKVCDAVAAAHASLVAHGDLKPSNILVSEEGEPKLLDFGVSKLLDESGQPVSVTGASQRRLTPEYASPEQLRGEPLTTATDLYSLGAMLHELIVGHRPYFPARGLELLRRVEDEDLPPLRPPSGEASVDPDLDSIVRKAMRKEPELRYATASELSEDLRRFSLGQPVQARVGEPLYRWKNRLRRHRRSLVLGTGILALVAFFSASWLKSNQRARLEQSRAAEAGAFLTDLLSEVDPFQESPGSRTVPDLLRQATERLDRLEGDPALQSSVALVLGEAFQKHALLPEAEAVLQRGAASADRLEEEVVLEARLSARLAAVVARAGRGAEARDHALEALALLAEETGRSAALVRAESREALGLARLRLGDAAGAAEAFAEVVAQRRRLGEQESVQLLNLLGIAEMDQGLLEEAEARFREAIALADRQGGTDPARFWALDNLAITLSNQGREREAVVRFRGVLAHWQETLGEHPQVALAKSNLASTLSVLGEVEEALLLADQALALYRSALPPDHPYLADSLGVRGESLRQLGRFAEADTALSESAAMAARLGDIGRQARALTARVRLLVSRGDLTEAEELAAGLLGAENAEPRVSLSGEPRLLAWLAWSAWSDGRLQLSAQRARRALELWAERAPKRQADQSVARALLLLAEQGPDSELEEALESLRGMWPESEWVARLEEASSDRSPSRRRGGS